MEKLTLEKFNQGLERVNTVLSELFLYMEESSKKSREYVNEQLTEFRTDIIDGPMGVHKLYQRMSTLEGNLNLQHLVARLKAELIKDE
jgi:hypothetical protein